MKEELARKIARQFMLGVHADAAMHATDPVQSCKHWIAFLLTFVGARPPPGKAIKICDDEDGSVLIGVVDEADDAEE